MNFWTILGIVAALVLLGVFVGFVICILIVVQLIHEIDNMHSPNNWTKYKWFWQKK